MLSYYRYINSRTGINNFIISQFLNNKDVAVICDRNLALKLLDRVSLVDFEDKNVCINLHKNEFIVSRNKFDEFCIQDAFDEDNVRKYVTANVIVVLWNKNMDLDYYLEEDTFWVVMEDKKANENNIRLEYSLEFGDSPSRERF